MLTLILSCAALCYNVAAQSVVRPYPLPDAFLQTTSILNHSSYLTGFDEPQWYLDNIPFVDFPDPAVQQIYYYRTSVLKRHLAYTREGHGWVFTEFIQPVPWASKFLSIPDSAAHQLQESRWLRDPSYAKDTIQHYTRGGVETIAGITYTHYIHDAILETLQAIGDTDFLVSQLDGMIYTFNLWNITRDNTTGLYHRTPLLDAQEFSLPGYVVGSSTGGPVEVWNNLQNNVSTIWLGPETYRPNFNAYMIAGAWAISTVASLNGNASIAATWSEYADDLYGKVQDQLWSSSLNFWIDVIQGTNEQVNGRELVGLFPYRFDVGTEQNYTAGLEATLNEDVFLSAYGPTTLEQMNPYYTAEKNLSYCCLWNGQSWPFSTAIYLGTLARLARTNASSVATPQFFYDALSTYTATHYHNDQPAVFEAHYPHRDAWSAYTTNHSEHYLHSTYVDNIFTNLIGIVPSLSDTLTFQPLVPSNWSYFAIENLPYHGTLLSILWDQNGSAYKNFNHSSGLSIYSNSTLIYNQATLAPFNVTLPSTTNSSIAYLSTAPLYVNILSNPNTLAVQSSFPYANATDTFFFNGNSLGPGDSAYKTNDGLLFYDNPPDNYWTNNQTYQLASWLNLTLPRPRAFSSVTIAVYADSDRNGWIACPDSVYVYATNATNGTEQLNGTLILREIPWSTCQPNARNTLVFNASVIADSISLYFVNALHYAVAIAEVEIWVPANAGPVYHAVDGIIGYFSQGAGRYTNGTAVDGMVHLGSAGVVEVANVRTPDGQASMANVTVVGSGGDITLIVNWLHNVSVSLSGNDSSVSVQAPMLAGGNVFTFFNDGDQEVVVDTFSVN